MPHSSPLSADDLITLNEEIAGMARAGLPLDQGLAALAKEMGQGRLQQVTADIAKDLQSGQTLPEALERRQAQVPPYYASLVFAGIRTGRLGEVLQTLTQYARAVADLKATIIGALWYPAIVLTLSLGLFALMLFWLVPQYAMFYHGFRMKIPWITQVLLDAAANPHWVVGIPLLVLVGGPIVGWLFLRRTAAGRCLGSRLVYSIPLVGHLLRAARLAAFADLMGLLVDQRVPLGEAWSLAAQASNDPFTQSSADTIREQLDQGQTLGIVLRQNHLVPELVAWMAGWGENQGQLGLSLHQVAEFYRRQAERRAMLLRQVLPPILVLLIGALIGLVFIAGLGAPLFQFIKNLGGIA